MLDPLLSDRDVERITGRARSTLQKDRVSGSGIPFVRIGPPCSLPAGGRSILPRCAAGYRSTSESATAGRLSSRSGGDHHDRARCLCQRAALGGVAQ